MEQLDVGTWRSLAREVGYPLVTLTWRTEPGGQWSVERRLLARRATATMRELEGQPRCTQVAERLRSLVDGLSRPPQRRSLLAVVTSASARIFDVPIRLPRRCEVGPRLLLSDALPSLLRRRHDAEGSLVDRWRSCSPQHRTIDLTQAAQAAKAGRIAWLAWTPATLRPAEQPAVSPLLDEIVCSTHLHDGKVFPVSAERLPQLGPLGSIAQINAVFHSPT